MTVQFKEKVNYTTPLPEVNLEENPNAYAKFIAESKQKKAKSMLDPWWVTRSYVTHSEQEPVVWIPYDHSTYTSPNYLSIGFDEWVEYLSKNTTINGYKIITVCLEMNHAVAVHHADFCIEKFKPVKKVYINGPKKQSLPKKFSGHY